MGKRFFFYTIHHGGTGADRYYSFLPETVLRAVDAANKDEPDYFGEIREELSEWLRTAEPGAYMQGVYNLFDIACLDLDRSVDLNEVDDYEAADALGLAG